MAPFSHSWPRLRPGGLRIAPRLRGLTMIELLTVVALLALIVAVVVAFLFPSDDRRVKQEAERLAAYCEAAGGEAKMSEGAIRVVLVFDEPSYQREAARIGARLTDLAWKEDEKAKKVKVRTPVKIAAVQVADAGTLEAGTAWLVWEDTKTRGGVVVLQLNEAIWSVVVDPATGQVRIEKGRATLPDAGKGIKRKFGTPALAALVEGTNLSAGDLDKLLSTPPPALPEHEVGDPPPPEPAVDEQPPSEPSPELPSGGALAPPNTPPTIPPPPTEPPSDPPPPQDAGVETADVPTTPHDPGEDPCRNVSCPDKNGIKWMCVVVPGEDSEDAPRCVVDPRGRAYLGFNYSMGGILASLPQAEAAQEYIRDILNVHGYKLQLVFPAEGAGGAKFDPLRFPMHMVQGGRQSSGDTYRGVQGLTTSDRAVAVLDAPEQGNEDEENAPAVWVMWPTSSSTSNIQVGSMLRSQQGAFRLSVPYTRAGQPCFWRLTTVINVVLVMVPAGRNNHRLIARLHTCLGGRNADMPVGSGLTLADVLETVSEPICDSNGDDTPDGWPIDLDARMEPITFDGDPSLYQGFSVEPVCN